MKKIDLLKEAHLLGENEARSIIKNLFEEIPAGICLFRMNTQLTILEANERFYNLFGYGKEQALREGFHSVYFLLNEQERERVRVHLELLCEGKLPEKGELELSVQHPNGKNVVVLAHYNYVGEGSDCITANVVDITDRKRIEEELRVSEKRYRLALNQSGKVFFSFDVKTRTMYLSDELAQGFGLPNVVGDMPENPLALSLVEPESQETYREFYRRILAGEEVGEAVISCHMRTEPDKVLWYKIVFTSVFNSEDFPVSTIITYEEYTERYQAVIEEQWRQADMNASLNGDFYLAIDYDLTRGIRQNVVGEMSWMLQQGGLDYEVMFFPVHHSIVRPEDGRAYLTFLNRDRLLQLFESGIMEQQIECQMLQRRGERPRWVRISVRMIQDPYTGHVLSRTMFRDIDDEKNEKLLIEQNMEDLKRKLEASRAKAMINQMQPHFLYNALSAIRTIIRKDPEKAYDLLYDFTVHLRSSIKAIASDAPIPFQDELKNIKAYLNIEKMRFEDSLQVAYEIDCENFNVIPLSIQPLAENAARHGIYSKGSEGGTVTVRSYESVSSYVVEVEDDGSGFDVQEVLDKKENSYGLKNLIFRLETLMHARIDIQSEIGVGTLIRIFFPKEVKAE